MWVECRVELPPEKVCVNVCTASEAPNFTASRRGRNWVRVAECHEGWTTWEIEIKGGDFWQQVAQIAKRDPSPQKKIKEVCYEIA